MKTILLALAFFVMAPGLSAEAPPVHFRGILDLGSARKFSLATDGGVKTAWVAVGDTFAGYEVAAFDADENKLILIRGGEETALSLSGASATASEPTVDAQMADATELLRSMKFEEMLSRSLEQQKEMMAKFTRQMAEQMGETVDEEAVQLQMRVLEVFNEEMDWPSLHDDFARMYSETFTREELRGLINFYSTPAGTAFIEKQPELSGAMMQVIQPRLMQAMPKMQQVMQDARMERASRPDSQPEE